VKIQKIADICYYSIILNIISIMSFSYKEETLWIFYGTTVFSVALMLLYIVIKQNTILIGKFHFALITWLGWVGASVLWSLHSDTSLVMVGTVAQLVVYSLIMYEYFVQSNISIDKLVNAIIIGVVGMGIYTLYSYSLTGFFTMFNSGFRVGAEINQENTYGFYAGMGVIAGLGQYFKTKRISNIIVIIISLVMVLASGSRAAIIDCVIGIIGLIIIEYGFRKARKTIMAFIFAGLAVYIMFTYFDDMTIVRRLDTFSNLFYSTGVADNSTTTRLGMIQYGLEQFIYRPIQGYGINNFRVLYQQATGWDTYSHNNFVELLVDVGIVGFSLYYYIYYIILRQAKKLSVGTTTIFVLILITIVDGVFGPNYYEKSLYIIFAMGYYSTLSKKQKFNDKKNSVK